MADTEAIEEKAAIERVARWLSIEALETIQNDLNNDFGVGGNEDAMTRLRLAAVTAELAQRGHSPRSFVVETETEEGWKNVWAEDGEPMTFATLVEAESAMQAAYDDADGLILPGSMRVAIAVGSKDTRAQMIAAIERMAKPGEVLAGACAVLRGRDALWRADEPLPSDWSPGVR